MRSPEFQAILGLSKFLEADEDSVALFSLDRPLVGPVFI
jgi:hypothetical protein